MYAGHFGIALAGKGLRARVPLWMFIGAAFSFDLCNLALELAGVEGRLVAWAGTAVGAVPVAAAVGVAFWAARGDERGAALLALFALLHVPIDLLTNKTALWPQGPRVGFMLYHHELLDLAVESVIVMAGWALYRRTLPPGARASWKAWAMPVGLVALQVAFVFW